MKRQKIILTFFAFYIYAMSLISGCAFKDQMSDNRDGAHSASEQVHRDVAEVIRSSDASRSATKESEIKPKAGLSQVPMAVDDELLSQKNISISVKNSSAGQLLWIFASEFKLGLAIDPIVLKLDKKINLHLVNVNGRDALNHILNAFDIYGIIGVDHVLQVYQFEERIFSLDVLAGRTSIDVSSGGDSFGGGVKGSSLKDSLSLDGQYGDKSDLFDNINKMISSIFLSENNASGKDQDREAGSYSLDRNSGILYVKARPSKIASVSRLLEQQRIFRARQIQIDAQLVDVQLTDSDALGIDWTLLGNNIIARVGTDTVNAAGATGIGSAGVRLGERLVSIPSEFVGIAGKRSAGISIGNDSFSLTINALKEFGKVKILSNPTLRVRNGAPAYLSVGTNYRYINKITSSTTTSGSGLLNAIDIQTDSVFSGLVIGVSANVSDKGNIELFIRPSQTVVRAGSLDLVDVGSGNKITLPVINAKSITTSLNLQDGDTAVIGGLIDQQYDNEVSHVPGLSEMPIFGNLFKSRYTNAGARELVMIIRVKIITAPND